MPKIVECIPNFSEGRREDVLQKLAGTATSVPGVMLLDYSGDKDHNRSVFTLAGPPEGVAEAAFLMCKEAKELIDLRRHEGEHPRMGATDVIPFVPIREVSMEECVALSKQVARRLWEELGIPVILYEQSASAPHRQNLAAVRKGQFEGMAEKLQSPDWRPDFGEDGPHASAGVTAVGARMPLIAFNVNLSTGDLEVASVIARAVRGSSGGYKYCKAMGVLLSERGVAQVSMNMVNFEGTPLYRVFEAIRFEAARYGVHIIGSELIGLAPARALIDCAEYYLKLEGFDYGRQVLENHLME